MWALITIGAVVGIIIYLRTSRQGRSHHEKKKYMAMNGKFYVFHPNDEEIEVTKVDNMKFRWNETHELMEFDFIRIREDVDEKKLEVAIEHKILDSEAELDLILQWQSLASEEDSKKFQQIIDSTDLKKENVEEEEDEDGEDEEKAHNSSVAKAVANRWLTETKERKSKHSIKRGN